ncbi:MAG: 30S ribosomal protein S4 [Candidatus Aenigmatarchaeota archaeon]
MRRLRKKYEKPRRVWDKERIEEEKNILREYGLRRKKELWRNEALLRKWRRIARELIGRKDEKKERELIQKLNKLGILSENASLDNVLGLTIRDILERRLQTMVLRKGFANSIKHARQLIVHGHVKIDGRKVLYPSYLVKKEEESKIEVK